MPRFLIGLLLLFPLTLMANVTWVPAGDLGHKQVLKTNDGKMVRVLSIEKKSGTQPMYNLTVNQNHNFFVGNHGGILVHNCPEYICQECGYTTKRLGNFNEHVKTVHTDKREYACTEPECGMSFKNANARGNHIREQHKGLKRKYGRNFPCTYEGCGKRFSRQSNLDDHLDSHANIKRYACPDCDYKGPTRAALRMHKNKYHPANIVDLQEEAMPLPVELANQPGPSGLQTEISGDALVGKPPAKKLFRLWE